MITTTCHYMLQRQREITLTLNRELGVFPHHQMHITNAVKRQHTGLAFLFVFFGFVFLQELIRPFGLSLRTLSF